MHYCFRARPSPTTRPIFGSLRFSNILDLRLQIGNHFRRNLFTQEREKIDIVISLNIFEGRYFNTFLYLNTKLIQVVWNFFKKITFWIVASFGMRNVLCACLMASFVKMAPSFWGSGRASIDTARSTPHTIRQHFMIPGEIC